MRGKEDAHDYRYFPDPDLPPLVVSRAHIEQLQAGLPELPVAMRQRWRRTYQLPDEHAHTFSEMAAVAALFDVAAALEPSAAISIANLVKGEVLRELGPEGPRITPADLAVLGRLKHDDRINNAQQKKMFSALWAGTSTLKALMDDVGQQVDDPAVLEPIVDRLFAAHPAEAEKFKAGEDKLLGFFMGRVMKETKGKAKPPLVQDILQKKRGP